MYAPVVYESIYGNTREVAEAVAEGPLEEGELERARAWGAELARELSVTSAR